MRDNSTFTKHEGGDHFDTWISKIGQLLTELLNIMCAKNKFWEKRIFVWTSSIPHNNHSNMHQIQIFTYITLRPFLEGW